MRGIPSDDELLPVRALDLQPVLAAAGAVWAVTALGDNALQPHGARLPVHRLAIAQQVL